MITDLAIAVATFVGGLVIGAAIVGAIAALIDWVRQ